MGDDDHFTLNYPILSGVNREQGAIYKQIKNHESWKP